MDKYKESLHELLGTLTARGIHYTGLIEALASFIEDDLSEAQFDDAEPCVQKEFEENTRLLLENATKHRELIEKVLAEWQKVHKVYHSDE